MAKRGYGLAERNAGREGAGESRKNAGGAKVEGSRGFSGKFSPTAALSRENTGCTLICPAILCFFGSNGRFT